MARTYGKIYTSIWRPESDYRTLTIGEQWLYQALISQPDLSHAGCLAYRPNRWARLAANITPEAVSKLVESLAEKRYLIVDMDTEEVLLRTFIRHDGGGNNPKMRKAISTAIALIESPALKRAAQTELDNITAGQSTSDHQSEHQSDHQSGSDPITEGIPSNSNYTYNSSSSVTARHLDRLGLHPSAIEALLLLCEFRITTATGRIDNPDAYCRKIIADELATQRPAITAAAERGDPPATIAANLFGVTSHQPNTPAWHADPDCQHCDGTGHTHIDPADIDSPLKPCDCRRTDPYLATVHELRGTS